MEKNKKICIVVMVEDDNIDNLKITINNLKENGCNLDEYIVATNNVSIKKYCKEEKINLFECNKMNDVYYEVPNNINADFISFINAGDKYSQGFKENLLNNMNESQDNIYVFPIIENEDKYILTKKLSKSEVVNIEKSPEKIWIQINSIFINRKLLLNIDKNEEDLKYYFEQSLITKLILLNGSYHNLKGINLTTVKKLEDSKESKLEDYELDWYKEIFKCISSISVFSKKKYGKILKYQQYFYTYIIKVAMNRNFNVKNKHIIENEELDNFYKNVKDVLQDVSDDVIMNTVGNKGVNYYLARLKYNKNYEDEIEYEEFANQLTAVCGGNTLFNANDIKPKILLMDLVDGTLKITAKYAFPVDNKKIKFYVTYMDKKIYATENKLYSKSKVFGKPVFEDYVFDCEIPLKQSNSKQYIRFFLETEKSNVRLKPDFHKGLSRLSNLKNSYWSCGGFIINHRKEALLVMKNTKLRHLKRELKYFISLKRNDKIEAKKSATLRLIYYATKMFFKGDIWLFEDKCYKGGDNGEYLYTYARKQKDGIKKYYVLNKGCIDTKRFEKEHKPYVIYGSLKHKLLVLNSTIIFETHNCFYKHHSFEDNVERYFRDIFNSDNVCIQHGLSVQYIPHLVNRINDNLKQYFLASPIEKTNLLNEEYAYKGYEDILKLTGSPRYDGLKNNDQRQILITPTWRNYLAMPTLNTNESRAHNNNFKKSKYFEIYNNLINNEKLIKVAKECNYKIIYLLHPCTSSQIDDFDKNDDVELIAATDDLNYEKILTESSLMVTDYSGVQFDFAYMYKPVVYFHPDELPPSYDEGEYKYDTMGLGEIIKTNDELVDSLCEYMRNDCKIKDEYKERIDNFFAYHDDNNCKRIYDDMMEFRNN